MNPYFETVREAGVENRALPIAEDVDVIVMFPHGHRGLEWLQFLLITSSKLSNWLATMVQVASF